MSIKSEWTIVYSFFYIMIFEIDKTYEEISLCSAFFLFYKYVI